MKKPLLLTYFVFFLFSLKAQSNLYLGVETGLTNDRIEYIDDSDLLVKVHLNNLRLGGIIGYTFNDVVSVETGFFIKNYTEGFGFEMPQFHSTSTLSSIRTWQIPLRIKTKVNLTSKKLFLVPSIGVHYVINRDHLVHNDHSRLTHSQFVNYDYSVDYSQFRTFPLLETGLAFEINAFKWMNINLTTSYFTGFTEVLKINMTYNVFDGEDIMVRGLSKGDYLNISLGLTFPIFKIVN